VNRKFISGLVVAFILISAAVSLAAEPAAKIKTLIITGGHGFEREPFFEVFKANPEISFLAAEHSKTNASAYDRSDLADYDVIVLYDMPKSITETQKASFFGILRRGTGLVVLHHALVSLQEWPEYEKIIGGRYPESASKSGAVTDTVGYQHDVEFPVLIVAKNHPILAGLENFQIKDEIYWGFRVGNDVTPLISTTNPKSGKPLGWCREQEKSRIVYLQLGHGPSAFQNENYRRLVAQSIRWAARR
jgi:type 1 glutamine amidotransferase